MYDVHNFPHLKNFFDISLINSPTCNKFDFERKNSKFQSEDSFFGGGEVMYMYITFPTLKILHNSHKTCYIHCKARIQWTHPWKLQHLSLIKWDVISTLKWGKLCTYVHNFPHFCSFYDKNANFQTIWLIVLVKSGLRAKIFGALESWDTHLASVYYFIAIGLLWAKLLAI